MAEQPPLNRFYVASYAANDRDFPIVAIRLDPRVAGYRVPEDLSLHPDSKRYPNHVFTGSQPSNGDERVTHIYEILPSPWVPFTRYDDDLGPVQGRRRSVKNEGQVASLAADKRVNYEAREGSAIVYTEIEETWSIETDDDGNSLFPVRDRDFYDASRGSVQERRQLFVPTGEEEGTLENVNGIITQTSYEPYNEFLSVKIVQTYKVNGPQLVGKATNNEGQLVTITTQRKAALNYISPNLTATRTVEASREDAESLVEQIVDTPSVFKGETKSIDRPDPVPQKFRVLIPVKTQEESLAGIVVDPTLVTTATNTELSKSEQQVTEFVKRVRVTSRNLSEGGTLTGYEFTSELGGGIAAVQETYPYTVGEGEAFVPTAKTGKLSDTVENLGDGTFLRRKVELPLKSYNFPEFSESGVFSAESLAPLRGQDYDEELDLVIPYVQVVADPQETRLSTGDRRRVTPRDVAHSVVQKYNLADVQESLDQYYWEIPDMVEIALPDKLKSAIVVVDRARSSADAPSVSGDTYSWSTQSSSSIRGSLKYDIETGFRGNVPTIRCVFFLPKENASPSDVLSRIQAERDNPAIKFWPNVKPEAHQLVVLGKTKSSSESYSVSFDSVASSDASGGSISVDVVNIPPTIHDNLTIYGDENFNGIIDATEDTPSALVSPSSLLATEYPIFPTGLFLYRINASPYKFSYTRVDALLVDITSEYV